MGVSWGVTRSECEPCPEVNTEVHEGKTSVFKQYFIIVCSTSDFALTLGLAQLVTFYGLVALGTNLSSSQGRETFSKFGLCLKGQMKMQAAVC